MHRRLLLPLAALAVAGLVATGCAQQSAAVRVGDESVSQQELFDELELIVTDEQFRNITFGASGEVPPLSQFQGSLGPNSYSQFLVGAVVRSRVEYLVAGQVLQDNGIEITDDDRDAVEAAIDRALGDSAGNLPPAYREDLVEGVTRLQVLQRELGRDELRNQMTDALLAADVQISSHFGSWDPQQGGVVPPPGPVQASGSGDGGSGSGSNSTNGSSEAGSGSA